tara:strand:+ start:740 stop:1903 length:1164 start_codon:yes stop_codon:yes gene_type:complete
MHLVDTFSLRAGLKQGSAHLEESFYPLIPHKYITIHTEDHPSKQWDHFQHCINILKPALDAAGISIVEVGYNKYPLSGTLSIKNSATLNQTAYVIKKSLLHIGPEGLFIQIASHYDLPLIALFSNTSAEYCGPRWGTSTNQITLEPSRNGEKPSYQADEKPKTLNFIFAETVAAHALDFLQIPHSLNEYQPVFCGPMSHHPCIEVVPDFEPNPQFYPRALLNIRLDYHFDENLLLPFANNRKLSLITETPINLSLLKRIKPAIEHVFYKVNCDGDIDYVKSLKGLGIPSTLLALPDDNLSETRYKFLDWTVEIIEEGSKKILDKDIKICDNTYFSSSKSLYSKGTAYPCKFFWDQGIKKEKYNQVIDEPEFWDEIEHYKLYRKQENV